MYEFVSPCSISLKYFEAITSANGIITFNEFEKNEIKNRLLSDFIEFALIPIPFFCNRTAIQNC